MPYVVIDRGEVSQLIPYISISHSGDIAAAAATQYPGTGIDVEMISEAILEIVSKFSTDEEVKEVIRSTGFNRITSLTLIWSIKEAVLKAAGSGTFLIKEIFIEKVRRKNDYTVCEICVPGAGNYRSAAFQEGGYAYAISRQL